MFPTMFCIVDGAIGDNMHFAITRKEAHELLKAVKYHLKKFPTDESVDMYNTYHWKKHEESRKESHRRDNELKKAKKKVGYVYLMSDSTHHLIKIGFSVNPQIRESTLQAEKPTCAIIYTTPGDVKYEKIVHAAFKDVRTRGEWFSISPEKIISYMEQNPFMP